MANEGFIKLYRKMRKWGWYDEPNTKAVFLHLLFLAQYEETFYRGIHLEIGQAVAKLPEIALENGMSLQNVRTAIDHLKSTGELTVKKYPRFSVYTINNYAEYNGANTQLTGNQHSHILRNKRNKEIPPLPPKGFEAFWAAYPKKTGKAKCREWWEHNTPDDTTLAAMVASIEYLKAGEQWQKEDGRYIPMPATWLNQRRWEDEDAQPPKPRKRKKPVYDRIYTLEERLAGNESVVVGWEDEP